MPEVPSTEVDTVREADSMEAVGRLAGGLAHDFSNLLTSRLGASEHLRERLPPTCPVADQIDLSRKSAERAASMTRKLLGVTRQRMAAPAILNLNDLLLGIERYLRLLLGDHIELRLS